MFTFIIIYYEIKFHIQLFVIILYSIIIFYYIIFHHIFTLFLFYFYFFIGPMEEIRRKTLLQGNDTFHGNGNQTGLFSSLRNSKLLSHITKDSFNRGEERKKWKR